MFLIFVFQDNGRELDKLCNFLGLSPPVEEKKQIVSEAHFDKMKKNDMVNYSTFAAMDFTVSSFMRKGNLKTKMVETSSKNQICTGS